MNELMNELFREANFNWPTQLSVNLAEDKIGIIDQVYFDLRGHLF